MRFLVIRIVVLIAVLLLAVPIDLSRAAQVETDVAFTFADGTLSDDEAIVRSGIAYAREFFEREAGVTVEGPIAIDVRGTQQFDVIAYSAPGAIHIATGAMGWHYAPPLRKLQTVIHEYIHLIHWQSDPAATMPLWLAEGSAEYLAWYAIDRLGLLDLATARDFWIGSLQANAALTGVPLGALEQPTIDGSAFVYEIGAFAVSELVERAGIHALFEYFAMTDVGRADAFAVAFGFTIGDFYAQFEAARAIAVPAGHDVSRLAFPWYPSTEIAEVTEIVVSNPVTRGEFALVQASTDPGAACTLTFHAPDGALAYTQAMRANSDGSIFWLWEIPETTPAGIALTEITCGANTKRSGFEIAAA